MFWLDGGGGHFEIQAHPSEWRLSLSIHFGRQGLSKISSNASIALRGPPFMMFSKFWGFWPPSPLELIYNTKFKQQIPPADVIKGRLLTALQTLNLYSPYQTPWIRTLIKEKDMKLKHSGLKESNSIIWNGLQSRSRAVSSPIYFTCPPRIARARGEGKGCICLTEQWADIGREVFLFEWKQCSLEQRSIVGLEDRYLRKLQGYPAER